MEAYFGIQLEFNSSKLEDIIKSSSQLKGYCCFVDANSLVSSYKNQRLKDVLNGSILNFCDGSYVATFASIIHKRKLSAYTGPNFFRKFIYSNNKHLILGNKEEVFNQIKLRVNKANSDKYSLEYISIPFLAEDKFEYANLGKIINDLDPDYIWVSLGAPKQEFFMNNLIVYLNRGIMFGVGAALNYFSGEIKDIPGWIIRLRLIWLYRLINEPKKQLPRILKIIFIFPKMILEEIKSKTV